MSVQRSLYVGPCFVFNIIRKADNSWISTILTFLSFCVTFFPSGHTNNFHNNEPYIRDYLIPRQEPYPFGEYSDRDPAVIAEHLRFSRKANIRVWVASFFGRSRREDVTLRETIMTHPDIGDLKIAIHYETNAVLRRQARQNDPNGFDVNQIYYSVEEYEDPNKASREDRFQGVAGDMDWFCEKYFSNPNYFFINGRPVIVIYLTRSIDNGDKFQKFNNTDGTVEKWDEYELLQAVHDKLVSRQADPSSPCSGYAPPFLVGDQIFNEYVSSRDDSVLDLMDAITG